MISNFFDIKLFKGRLVILPIRELTLEEFAPVKEVFESNAVSYILDFLGDEERHDGWVFGKTQAIYTGAFKIRFIYADDLNKKVAELEAKHNVKLDMMERAYLDTISKAFGVKLSTKPSKVSSFEEFEATSKKENNTERFYKEAVLKTNKDYGFRNQVYK